ncbi:unnamed protein product [Arabis nemorensis]|uniref:Plastid lipid-associated protein/fibrillin conserved domain-containing protein n=1 Tax=Arabis nemorensis TaxID=586526 RepID=A0A565BPK3_9BRAS|nr:unnamed protein product [Arabis nemorensis]
MDRIASATFSCPAISMSRLFRIKPFGLNLDDIMTNRQKNFSCRVAVASGDTTFDLEHKKHDLLRAVTVEGFNGGEDIDLVKLDGTWRLQYTSAPDVGQVYQKFECRDRSDGGIIRNVVQWSLPSLLEEQEGATLVVTAKFDKVTSRNIYLQFEEISVRNIIINEQLQALIAPAILPRSFLTLQILQFIRNFKAQIPVTATSPGRRSVGGLYYLSYLDNNMLLGRSVGGGGVFVFTKSQPLEL